jgi:hypothetical protein
MRTRFLGARKALTVAAAATLLVVSTGVVSVLAVHDLNFQLDGDVIASTPTNIGPPPPPITTQALDWDSLFTPAGTAISPRPTGFTSSGFERDFQAKDASGTCSLSGTGTFCTADTTTYATGSKDTLPITPGWQCNFDNNVNSKIDVMNAYAAGYTNPANGHEIVYFALERNTNTGDANVGFWFLQGGVGCASTGGSQPFSGPHVDGDILIVSAFTKGGGVSVIDAYRWNGDDVTGSLGTNSVAAGVDCKVTSGLDAICGTSNSGPNAINTPIATPWLTANFKDGVDHNLREAEFFEGGLDLTAKGLGGKCFNTFIGDTRSSQSLTATLFDYALGTLGSCSLRVTTTPSITTCVLGSCTGITDTADLAGTSSGGGAGTAPTGTVSFFLCGPGVTTCASGGAPIPSDPAAAVTLGACDPAAAGHACATSAPVPSSLITGVGTYCFRAVYDPGTDPNYAGQGGSFTSVDECFTVTGVATLSTNQNWVPNDSATITGPTSLSGTATFTLYHDADCGAGVGEGAADIVYGPEPVTVSGSSPQTVHTTNSNPATLVVLDATDGEYSWLVSYADGTLGAPDNVCETTTIAITD